MNILDIFIMIFASIVSYFLGGISIARFITKRKKDGNIVASGSGNPGTMNMLRTHGIVMGLFTLLCDALKGYIPAIFGKLYFMKYGVDLSSICMFLFGFCAVVGHIFPIYYKFKGGKGIATTFGVFFAVDPLTSGILFAILFVTLYFIKIGSVVSLLYIIVQAIVQMFREYTYGNGIMLAIMWAMVVLDIFAHRKNIDRLVNNTENTVDLEEGLKKDIQKIKNIRKKKLDKNKEEKEKIKDKYERKIQKRHREVAEKIAKINSAKQVSEKSEESDNNHEQ